MELVKSNLLTTAQIEKSINYKQTFEVPVMDVEVFEKIEDGPMSIDEVDKLLNISCRKMGQFFIDSDTLCMIDASIDYKVFFANELTYTWEKIYENYPFVAMGIQPEAVFTRLYVTPVPIYDTIHAQVGITLRIDRPESVTEESMPTKIYLGEDAWEDFKHTARIYSTLIRKNQVDEKMLELGLTPRLNLLQLK